MFSPTSHVCIHCTVSLSHTYKLFLVSKHLMVLYILATSIYSFSCLKSRIFSFSYKQILSSFVGEFVLFFVVYLFGGFIWYFSHFSLLWLNFQHYFALYNQVLLEYKHCDIVVDDLITKTVSRKLASRQGSHYEYIRPMMIYVYGMTKQEDLGFNPSTQNIMKSRSYELFISDIFQSTLVDLCN